MVAPDERAQARNLVVVDLAGIHSHLLGLLAVAAVATVKRQPSNIATMTSLTCAIFGRRKQLQPSATQLTN